jgi:hypothetical protein
MTKTTFAKILEAVDRLSTEDRKNLLYILQNRLRDRRGLDLAIDIQEAQKEFVASKCKPVTPEEIIEETLW